MKGFVKILFVLFVAYSNLKAVCVYVSCSPEGISGQLQISMNISAVDAEIQDKLSDFSSKTDDERALLDEIIEKQELLINLAKQREVLLQKIAQEATTISHIIRIQE